MAERPYLQYSEGCVCGVKATGTETCQEDGLWKCGHCHKYVCKNCQHFDEFDCDSKPYGYDDGWWIERKYASNANNANNANNADNSNNSTCIMQ